MPKSAVTCSHTLPAESRLPAGPVIEAHAGLTLNVHEAPLPLLNVNVAACPTSRAQLRGALPDGRSVTESTSGPTF